MRGVKRWMWIGLWIAASSVVLLLALVPQRHVPQWLAPFVTANGRFVGEEVRVAAPECTRPEVTVSIKIHMDRGVCRVSLKCGDDLSPWFTMGEGRLRDRMPAGSLVVLDPQGNPGAYDVIIGPRGHLLGPRYRRLIFLPVAIAMVAAPFFAGRFRSHAKRLGNKRLLFLVAVAVLSALLLYPALHEGGHMIFGVLAGATPDWGGVVWTCLGGEEPHASFSQVPEGAIPLMSAGGPVVPTVVALLLLLIWRIIYKKASWYLSAALVAIAVLFLFSTFGCVFELYQNTHMDALSVHLGLTGLLRIAVSLGPLLVAIAAYAWLIVTFRNLRSGG